MENTNQKVIDLIDQIKTEVVDNGKDLFTYIVSILTDEPYEYVLDY